MIWFLIGFILGSLACRLFYARMTGRTDWMRSWEWSSNKYYIKFHRFMCETCPKRHYCERYKEK